MKHILNQLIIIIIFSIELNKCDPQVTGQCGRPLLPPKATKHRIPNEKIRFENKENVIILCSKDGYIFNQYPIECINGKWTGKRPRCGQNIEAMATNVKIYDCEPPVKKLIVSQHLNQSADSRGGHRLPQNVFHRLRVGSDTKYYANGSTCYTYEVTLDRKIQLWFLSIQLWAETVISTRPELTPFINKYRTCELRRNRTEITKSKANKTYVYHTYHYICDLKTDSDYLREQNDLLDTISLNIKVNNTDEIGLEGIFLGKIFIDPKRNRPQCGYIQEQTLGLVIEEKFGNTFISCNDSFIDQNLSDNVTDYAKNGNPKHKFTCNWNGEWNGSWPICVPIETCSKHKTLSEKDNSVVIEEIGNVYYLNESQWFAINESYVRYTCLNVNDIMFSDDKRTCLSDGKWTEMPYCVSAGMSGLAITGILFAVLIVFVSIVFCLFRFHTKRVNRKLKETRNEIQGTYRVDALYSDIDNNYNEYETDFNYSGYNYIEISVNQPEYLNIVGTDHQFDKSC